MINSSKRFFPARAIAEEFLLNYLPSNVIKHLDLKSLEYAQESFVDKHLAEYFSDLLCRINLKDGSLGYIYLLFEHKNHQEPLAAFHILRYMVKILELWLKEKVGQRFPRESMASNVKSGRKWPRGHPLPTERLIPAR